MKVSQVELPALVRPQKLVNLSINISDNLAIATVPL